LARIEILLSNDDGLDALGLQVLYTALAAPSSHPPERKREAALD
jgi:broad specificity polyphosphatase/5'/3'-nucleotidase SurE